MARNLESCLHFKGLMNSLGISQNVWSLKSYLRLQVVVFVQRRLIPIQQAGRCFQGSTGLSLLSRRMSSLFLPQGKILYIFAGRRFDAVWRISLFWRLFSLQDHVLCCRVESLQLPEAFGFCWVRYSVAWHRWWSDMAGQPWLWTSTAMPLGESQMVIPWKQAHSKRWDTMIAGFGKTWCWGIETQLLLVIMAKNEKNEKNSENEHSKVRFWMVFDGLPTSGMAFNFASCYENSSIEDKICLNLEHMYV